MEALILSWALDTNGQNERYRRAAAKFGASKGVIRALALGNADPAGVVHRFQTAADKLGGLSIRSAHRSVYIYLQFPFDIHWTRTTDRQVRQLAAQADVIHLNNSDRAAQMLHLRKPTLLHHHGSLFRDNHKVMLARARQQKWVQAVSTPDLMRFAPDVVHWLPTAYDISELLEYGKAHRRKPDGKVRILSAPTNRAYKHTELLISVVSELQAEGLPIELELVENKTWAECLERKAQADIVFDQIMFGYGCNAVEAWGLGIPVIAGGDDWTLSKMREMWGGLPFYLASEDTLKERIREMVKSKALRAEWAGHGMAHVRKYHDEKPALEKLAELYALSMKTYQSGRGIPGKEAKPVTFTYKRNTLSMDGVYVSFIKGQAEVSDPYLIERLRNLQKTRPNFGVKEVA